MVIFQKQTFGQTWTNGSSGKICVDCVFQYVDDIHFLLDCRVPYHRIKGPLPSASDWLVGGAEYDWGVVYDGVDVVYVDYVFECLGIPVREASLLARALQSDVWLGSLLLVQDDDWGASAHNVASCDASASLLGCGFQSCSEVVLHVVLCTGDVGVVCIGFRLCDQFKCWELGDCYNDGTCSCDANDFVWGLDGEYLDNFCVVEVDLVAITSQILLLVYVYGIVAWNPIRLCVLGGIGFWGRVGILWLYLVFVGVGGFV